MTLRSHLTITLLVLALASSAAARADDEWLERMAAEHAGDTPAATPAARTAPAVEVTASEVAYATVDGKPINGYLAHPAGAGPWPGLLVIHEWWGLNDNIRAMARRLAGEGYAALAVDLYAGEVATDREAAGRLARASGEHPERGEDNLRQAYAYLAHQVGAPKVGVIGWCFGGGWSLQTALLLPGSISAATIYYGRLDTDRERLARLSAPILGLFGAEDQGIPVASVRQFEATLTELGKQVEIRIYDGADHAFANPSGTRYDAVAAEDAWARTLAFFARHLKP